MEIVNNRGRSGPLVSVVLPTFDRASLLPRAVESVLSQTYHNLELLIVDDGSTDDSLEVLSKFDDPRIIVEHLRETRGAPHARNVGIRLSGGEFIAFIDSDDEWLSNKLEKQVALLSRSSERVGLVGSGREFHSEVDGKVRSYSVVVVGDIGNIYRELLSGVVLAGGTRWPGPTQALMLRRECFDSVGMFDEELECAQDYDLIVRVAKRYDFVAVSEPLVIVHSDADFRISTSNASQVAGRKAFLDKYNDEFPPFSRLKADFSFHVGIRVMRTGNPNEGRKYLLKAVLANPTVRKYWWNLAKSLMR